MKTLSSSIDKVAPLVVYLGHESCPLTNNVIMVGGGFFSVIKFQRSQGLFLPDIPSAEQVRDNWKKIEDPEGHTLMEDAPEYLEIVDRLVREYEAKPKL
mmetsp:Transcript_16464/g.29693  ORF Transcript_16464/g.29693 Transcript_16464/m.29693 type:complete len:99 (+) Transcript_16464:725-1021(+)